MKSQKSTVKTKKFHDRHFLVRFLTVVVLLHGVIASFAAIAIVIDRSSLYDTRRHIAAAHERAQMMERLAPPGEVITDMAALEMTAPATQQVAARAPLSADAVVTQVCAACHQAGVLGAPRVGDAAAWQARAKAVGGMDALVQSAIKGKNAMPPRGGRADLTDAEVRAATEAMARSSGA